uniref:Uncharacterized protein n=1 Tax=Amphimedon queenslandica TaxID=400682 RepID=A0A1X7T8T8_AMPQE
MEGAEQSQTYQSLNSDNINKDGAYELCQVTATEESGVKERRAKLPEKMKKLKNMELKWNKPVIIFIIVLLLLIVILQVVFFCLLVAHMTTSGKTCTCTSRAANGGDQ